MLGRRSKRTSPDLPPKGKLSDPRSKGMASASGLPWFYGTHAVLAALRNTERALHRLLLTSDNRHTFETVLHDIAAQRRLPQIEIVRKEEIEALLPAGAVHQGIILQTSPLPARSIEDVVSKAASSENVRIVILDQVTDPHNVGAIIRSAAAFGALAVIVPDRASPDESGTLAKSASGALERVTLVRVTNLSRALHILKEGGFWCVGLDGHADRTLAEAKLSGKIALVLGSEGDGLRRLTRETCDYLLRLPINDAMESLNVSNAAAIALYETART